MTNVLFILMDDVGVECFSAWGRGGSGTYGYANTSEITALAGAGMRFNRAYVEQLCSPTRAAFLTGRHPFRTGMGDIIRDDADGATTQQGLSNGEHTLASVLRENGYATAIFGKWHLGNTNTGGRQSPLRAGFDQVGINMFNLASSNTHDVAGTSFREGYYAWGMTTTEGEFRTVRSYHTSHCVDLAIQWIKAREEPWFCYLPLFGVHSPFNNRTNLTPNVINTPSTLLYDEVTWNLAADADQTTTAQVMHAWRAGIEATDTEIGRLLDAIPSDTLVIFASDNGSPSTTLANEVHPTLGAYPSAHSKDSPYEPGIWCPLAIKGPGISVGTYDKLVSAVDLFPTVLALLNIALPTDVTIDGVSLVGPLTGSSAAVRATSFSQWFGSSNVYAERTTEEWAIIGDADASGVGRYKLLKPSINGAVEFYDLGASYDPMEATNLMLGTLTAGELAAFNYLTAAQAALVAS